MRSIPIGVAVYTKDEEWLERVLDTPAEWNGRGTVIDLLIADGLVVSEEGERSSSVGIQGERIVFVGPSAAAPGARRTISCEGHIVLPGLIDPHWHIGQQPGPAAPLEQWLADVGPETAAAARGGVTTVFSMDAKQQSWPPLIDQLIAAGNQRSHVDFNFHPILQSADHIDEIDRLFSMGVTSYKFFFDAYKGWEGEQIGLSPVDAGLLHRAFTRIARLGQGVALIHAEDQDLIHELQETMRSSGRTDLAAWAETRPAIVELTKSYQAIQIAKRTRAPLYVVHIGAREVAELIATERRAGHRIYGETCPHYLTHHQDMEDQVGSYAKVNNAIKSRGDSEGLWRAIVHGGITNMGTDHVCWTRDQKENSGGKFGNIWKSLPGIAGGTEHWLPVMLTYGVGQGRIGLRDLVRVTSTANARTFGLYPKKGVIAPGSDADIVVVDPDREVVVDPATFYRSEAASTWSIYEGWTFRGMPILTVLRGEVVVENGEVAGGARGRFVPRPVVGARTAGSHKAVTTTVHEHPAPA